MGRKSWLYSLLIIWILTPVLVEAEVSLTARVDRRQITTFDTITYTLTMESSSRKNPNPIPPDFNGFKVQGPPQTASQFSWVNGQSSTTRTYTYTLQAKQEGAYVLGPARVVVDGETILSAPIKITVIKPEQAKAGVGGKNQTIPGLTTQQMGNVFIRGVVNNDSPYVGEPIRLSIYLYTRVNIRNYQKSDPDYQGFWMEPVELPSQPQLINRVINGIEYGEAKVNEVILYPTMTGELTIAPMTMQLTIQPQQRSIRDDFFNSPFSAFNSRTVNRSSQAMTINVKPLPSQGKPAAFHGAVGEYSISADISESKVNAGDAVVVLVSVSGESGLQTLQAPTAPDLPDFKLYDPKSREIEPDMKIPGNMVKTWEYILVPFNPGQYTIPSFTLSYFNPDTSQYKRAETDTFNLLVESTPGSVVAVSHGVDREPIRLLNADIRYIKTAGKIHLWRPLYFSSVFLVLMSLPIVVVPVLLLMNRRHLRLQGDTMYAREVKARSVSGKRFARAKEHLSENRLNEALDHGAAAFSRYLADRLGLPTGGCTLAEIEQGLIDRHVPENWNTEIRTYLEALETARYAPVDPEKGAVSDLIRTGQNLVDRLEKVKIRKTASPSGRRS